MKPLTKKQRKILWQSALLFSALFFSTIIFIAEKKFSQLVFGGLGDRFSTQVFSSPLLFKSGANSPGLRQRTLKRLSRLGYQKKSTPTLDPGEYQENGN